MKPKEGSLRVWHVPQIPGKPFRVAVDSPEEGHKILAIIAKYDIFQLENNIKPDFSNAGGLEVFTDGEWIEWDDEEGDGVDEAFEDKEYEFFKEKAKHLMARRKLLR